MVYKGPSRGCYTCRKRRVKCDEQRPECGNCKKRKQHCPGYRDLFDTLHKDETPTVAQNKKPPKKIPKTEVVDSPISIKDDVDLRQMIKAPSVPPTPTGNALILIEPSRDAQAECLAYFFSNYVNIPRDPSTNIFIEHILPLYLNAPANSALAQSVNAVAINITQMWMSRYTDSYLARQTYANAVGLLKTALADPVESKSDDTLAAVFLLDFYDSLNKRFVGFIDNGTHQQGAVALLRHRGKENFKTPTSQRLFTALRSRHISYSMQAGQRIALNEELLAEETAVLPSAKLDLINAELADLHVLASEGAKAMNLTSIEFYKTIIRKALAIDKKLGAWRQSLPKSWQPVAVPSSELHPSIRAAGVYGDTVDVYSSLTVSHVNNASRSSQVGALRLMALCKRELEALGVDVDPRLGSHLTTRAQEVIDRFCASVPYHLGNRTTLRFPHEHSEYPHVPEELRKLANYVDPFGNPVEMTQEDHIRAAAAIGGWFVMTPLTGFLKSPILRGPPAKPGPLVSSIRPGQLDWIRGQMQRLQNIYGLPTAAAYYTGPSTDVRLSSPDDVYPKVLNRQLWQV
ncbi:uncharacterized protein PV06_03402 [Exophiala oligosperma]|uniref:Zn(2)-C6 fungal-type domain-containing protein n=1 Tax=Exophiala oligosperma TaxID=215243 RepID=A0A0D2DRE9_9EURO|nr:uncharacterized protein PV06_03402 [Exophiala oligosperma]KIW44975.1 hypothetical protein PV06_03402 [Exophiala oligosperma]